MPNSIVAIVNDKLAGYILVSEIMGEVEIEDICILPTLRKTGIASKMFAYIIEQTEKQCAEFIFLEVASRNASALALYKKMGFEIISVRKNYYVLPEQQFDDAVIMRRVVKNSI